MMPTREFHQVARTGKTRVWTIEVVGDEVRTSYGEMGGKMQHVVDVGERKNIGRTNETSAEDDALAMAEREILKKTRDGYCEEGTERATQIGWNSTLPINLRFYKPDNTLSTTLEKKLEAGRAWLSRKRDGECLVVMKGPDGVVDIYSRRMLRSHHLEVGQHVWRDRFPLLAAEIEQNDNIPPCSILLGDVVGSPTEDRRWDVATYMKVKTAEIRERGLLEPLYYCWDIPFADGSALCTITTIGDRYDFIWSLFGRARVALSRIVPVEVWSADEILQAAASRSLDMVGVVDCAKIVAKERGFEGWVIVDPEGEYGDKAYNFRGKTDRPGKFCGKLKPEFEDDFLGFFDPDNVRGGGVQGKWGAGNNRGQVGAISLYQHNSKGKLVYISEVGGGIDDAFRAKYSDPLSPDWPLVLEVKFFERTFKSDGEKTNALTYPSVVRVREDKGAFEVVEPRLDEE